MTTKRRTYAPICDYCGKPALLTTSAEIYNGRDYGMIYICRPCDARVGVHKGTLIPLGRLANKELRTAKLAAHNAFDPIWQNGEMSRSQAYAWLAKELGIRRRECHIGLFDVDGCRRVVDLCIAREFQKLS